MGANTECLQHLLCLHYSELVTEIFKETDFKSKLKGKSSQTAFLLLLCSFRLLRLCKSPTLIIGIENHIMSL